MYQIITGGIEKCLIRILDEMCLLPEYEFRVVTKRKVTNKAFLDFFAKRNIKLITLPDIHDIIGEKPKNFVRKKIWKIKRLPFLWKQKAYIKKYLQNSDILVDYFNCSFCAELMNINKPKIGWFHSGFGVYNHNNTEKYFKCYDKFVVLTEAFRRDLVKLSPQYSHKIIQMYNPLNLENIADAAQIGLSPDSHEKYFVFVARMHPDKDHLTCIKAFSEFSKYHPEAKMYFIGDGEKRSEYEKTVRSFHLEDKIIFTGILGNPFGYIKNALANILSSPSEGLSNVLIEAAALKTLNIASDCPSGPSEILLNGKAGLLFPVGDSEKLSVLMSDVWGNKIDVQTLINTGYNSLHRFSSDTIIQHINHLFQEMADLQKIEKGNS
jgi:glycosyltransferase involved in cell wall biosynthesis